MYRCQACAGSGRIMGGGLIFKDCYQCSGTGKIAPVVKVKLSKARYKKAIENIKALDESLTDDQAKELFETEFNKLEKTEVENVKTATTENSL